jgi:hypothetical protein
VIEAAGHGEVSLATGPSHQVSLLAWPNFARLVRSSGAKANGGTITLTFVILSGHRRNFSFTALNDQGHIALRPLSHGT